LSWESMSGADALRWEFRQIWECRGGLRYESYIYISSLYIYMYIYVYIYIYIYIYISIYICVCVCVYTYICAALGVSPNLGMPRWSSVRVICIYIYDL